MATHNRNRKSFTFDGEPVIHVNEAASIIGVHPETIRNYIKGGRLRAYALPKRYLIPLSAWNAFVADIKGACQ